MTATKSRDPSQVVVDVASTISARTAAADARAYDAVRRLRLKEKRRTKGFEAVRPKTAGLEFDELAEKPVNASKPPPLPPPHAVAARVLLAAAVDAEPGLADALAGSAPVVVVVDVPDPAVLTGLQTWWTDVLAPGVRTASARNVSESTSPGKFAALDLFVAERPKPARKAELALAATVALHLGARTFAFSPDARSHLPDFLVATADFRIAVGPLDAGVVREVVRIVTGRACRGAIDGAMCGHLGILDLSASVRPGRAPSDCVARLAKIAAGRVRERDVRDLRLQDLHGMDDAVAWSRSALDDVKSWRNATCGWSSVDRAVLLTGPPGTGKTTLAKCMAAEGSMNLVVGSFAKWQSRGHLGDFLAGLRSDFNEIRRTGGESCYSTRSTASQCAAAAGAAAGPTMKTGISRRA